jgi:hypothetical protein
LGYFFCVHEPNFRWIDKPPVLGSGLVKSQPEDDGCCDAYA